MSGDINDDVVDAICEGVEGNPFFLEERVASLLDTGALHRHAAGWRLRREGTAPVPEALERLIRSRADRLSLPAREVIVAASVLGQEIEPSALGVVSELAAELDDAVSEVLSAGLLVEVRDQSDPRYRFRHALIREATYSGLLRPQRRQLHARAAWDLEARFADRLDEVVAMLGGHFAAAGHVDRAAHYLELAGDRAARIFANDEAIELYRQVLAVIDGDGKAVDRDRRVPGPVQTASAAAVCEKLSARLSLIDRFGEARAVALDGIARTPEEDTLRAARLQYLLATLEGQENHRDVVDELFEAAEKLVRPCGLGDDQERVDVWLAVQVNRAWNAQLCNEVERAASILASARPLAEARGSPGGVAGFYMLVSMQHIIERRYQVDAEILAEHRRAAKAAQEAERTEWDLINLATLPEQHDAQPRYRLDVVRRSGRSPPRPYPNPGRR